MKTKIPFFITALLIIAVILLFAFNTSSHTTKHKVVKKSKDCNCLPVNASTVHERAEGEYTDLFYWDDPVGGDPISSYTVGGYWSCDGAFGPYTADDAISIPVPHYVAENCNHGTISIITNCSTGCSSTSTIATW